MSQQVALERGLPAIIGNFISKQLPFPSLSHDMVHCAQCGIIWDDKDGMFLIEVDRVLKPGGYFVLTSPRSKKEGSSIYSKQGSMSAPSKEFTQKIKYVGNFWLSKKILSSGRKLQMLSAIYLASRTLRLFVEKRMSNHITYH
ncbi:Probable methyltransferase PMT4 [Olea europaea subsp. europaea]|uniref:Methyltransferase n=1 Tax=Olea europaea subsp. europaea TaxID=158383 RepID=A0A8S0VBR2_OLEEU|nr:Probable methyltransferase PMT4 [Olea europaea subsp. europaea]